MVLLDGLARALFGGLATNDDPAVAVIDACRDHHCFVFVYDGSGLPGDGILRDKYQVSRSSAYSELGAIKPRDPSSHHLSLVCSCLWKLR